MLNLVCILSVEVFYLSVNRSMTFECCTAKDTDNCFSPVIQNVKPSLFT